jgi:hypothetical protein
LKGIKDSDKERNGNRPGAKKVRRSRIDREEEEAYNHNKQDESSSSSEIQILQ